MKVVQGLFDARQLNRRRHVLAQDELVEIRQNILAGRIRRVGEPGGDDLGIRARGKDRVWPKASGLEVVTDQIQKRVSLRAVPGGCAQRQLVCNREPGCMEIDKRPVLVEQNSLDSGQAGYSAFVKSWTCR